MTVQADDPISFMQLTAKNEMTSKEDQFQLSLLAAMGNTQRKEAADPLASKLNKVNPLDSFDLPFECVASIIECHDFLPNLGDPADWLLRPSVC